MELDGVRLDGSASIPIVADAKTHRIRIVLGGIRGRHEA